MQFVLVVVNAIIAVLGFVVMIVGIVAKISEGKFMLMSTDNTDEEISVITTMLLVIGLLICIVGVFGAVGSLFSHTTGGRGVLLLYAAMLAMLVIFEFSGGIAAGVKRNEIDSVFRLGINDSFMHIKNHPTYEDSWIEFQQSFQCCGVNNYSDWAVYLNKQVPQSCCKVSDCTAFWPNGCTDYIVSWLESNAIGIAVVALLFAILQIFGVAGSCFVAFYTSYRSKYQKFV